MPRFVRRRHLLLLAALVAVFAGCRPNPPAQPDRADAGLAGSSSAVARSAEEAAASAVPPELVGSWHRTDEAGFTSTTWTFDGHELSVASRFRGGASTEVLRLVVSPLSDGWLLTAFRDAAGESRPPPPDQYRVRVVGGRLEVRQPGRGAALTFERAPPSLTGAGPVEE